MQPGHPGLPKFKRSKFMINLIIKFETIKFEKCLNKKRTDKKNSWTDQQLKWASEAVKKVTLGPTELH